MSKMKSLSNNELITNIHYYSPLPNDQPPPLNDVQVFLGTKDRDTVTLPISDIRDFKSKFALYTHGFQLLIHPSPLLYENYFQPSKVEEIYVPAVAERVKVLTGARRALYLNHQIRARLNTDTGDGMNYYKQPSHGPAKRAHIDYSTKGAKAMLRHFYPDAAEDIISGRWGVVNVWRPLKTVERDPLAMCDARSVPETDLVPFQRRYEEGYEGENVALKVNPSQKGSTRAQLKRGMEGHQWYWLSNQTPDECWMITTLDSDSDGGKRARRTPHSSVHIDGTEHLPPRESIEARFFVVY